MLLLVLVSLLLLQAKKSWGLPPLRELVFVLPLTPMQRRLYLWLLTRDSRLLLGSQPVRKPKYAQAARQRLRTSSKKWLPFALCVKSIAGGLVERREAVIHLLFFAFVVGAVATAAANAARVTTSVKGKHRRGLFVRFVSPSALFILSRYSCLCHKGCERCAFCIHFIISTALYYINCFCTAFSVASRPAAPLRKSLKASEVRHQVCVLHALTVSPRHYLLPSLLAFSLHIYTW